jgi:hypothetical protein
MYRGEKASSKFMTPRNKFLYNPLNVTTEGNKYWDFILSYVPCILYSLLYIYIYIYIFFLILYIVSTPTCFNAPASSSGNYGFMFL